MSSPVSAAWTTTDDLTWELQGTNNGPDDIFNTTLVKVPGGPVGEYPLALAPGESHTFKTRDTDPGAIAHYVLYYSNTAGRWACDNTSGVVTGPL